jgi:hypothetical protein
MSVGTITIIVKNNTAEDKDWGGTVYLADTETQIEDVDRLRLLSDPTFMTDLYAGVASISDGDSVLPIRVGVGLLQNNSQVLVEYYTLTSEDDILIGNGQILQLHDDKWELQTDFEQDDVQ